MGTSPSGMTASEAARLRGERARSPGAGKRSYGGTGYHSVSPVPPPVAWTPDRDARGRAPDRGRYRCPRRGCPVVSGSLRAMVAHVRAHEDEDASITALDVRVPGPRLGGVMERREHGEPCACGCGKPIAGPPSKRFASDACRQRYNRAASACRPVNGHEKSPAP